MYTIDPSIVNAFYNNLPSSVEVSASTSAFESKLLGLQEFLVKNNQKMDIPVVVLHKHFDAMGAQVPIWRYEDKAYVLKSGLPTKAMVPVTWSIQDTGEIIAYEFADFDSFPSAHVLKERYGHEWSERKEQLALLRETGLNNHFAVTLVPNIIKHAESSPFNYLLEDDLEGAPGLRIDPSTTFPTFAKPSVWKVTPEGYVKLVGWVPCEGRPD